MLKNKVIVISGGAGLIGRGLCKAIVDANGQVAIADINKTAAQKLARDIGSRAKAFALDITCQESIAQVINDVVDVFGSIDGLVNSAYPRTSSYGKDFLDVTYDDFCGNLSLHLGGYFLSSQLFGKYFIENGGGNIINFSSIYGVIAPRFQIYENTQMTMPVEYAAIKSAIIHLTKYMSRYFKGNNIRVNSISPGGIFDNQPDAFVNSYGAFCSNTGMLDYNDINGTLLFLLSDLSKQITGQNIIVDDGFSL